MKRISIKLAKDKAEIFEAEALFFPFSSRGTLNYLKEFSLFSFFLFALLQLHSL